MLELLELGEEENIQVERIVLYEKTLENEPGKWEDLLAMAKQCGTDVVGMAQGDKVQTDTVTLECLYPLREQKGLTGNASSLVLSLEAEIGTGGYNVSCFASRKKGRILEGSSIRGEDDGIFRALFTGDLETDGEAVLLEEYFKEHREDQHRDYYQQSNIRREMTDMETTVLCTEHQEIVIEDAPQELCLKSMNPQKYSDIYIEKNSIVLGCMLGSCSYLIKENGISRMHAKLIKKEDGLFLIDLNSTNGTYLNDELIVGGKEHLLEEGDVISLAKIVTFVVTVRGG